METFALWVFGLLFISLPGAHGLDHFPGNFVVAKRDDANPVTLTCDTNSPDAVTWKLNEKDVALKGKIRQVGQNLVLSDIDVPDLGQYSCWSKDGMVSSTYLLLLEAEDQDEQDSPIHCRAKSYDCTFTCEWRNADYDVVRLGLGHDCSEGGKCQWFNSRGELPEGGFQFELSHSLSPYAEESTMLEVTAEAISNLFIFRTTERFYLREIIQPDSPKIDRCQEVEQKLNITIIPPATWSTPHSFFNLEHEIEYILKDNGQAGHSLSSLIPKEISMLRARSRDPLVPSHWSQWTPWKNVKGGKRNLCKFKKRAKPCHPESASGNSTLCKKIGKEKKGTKMLRGERRLKKDDVQKKHALQV